MASVSDIHNFSDQFQYQLRKLNDADIDLNGRAGTVTLNQEAVGRKGASGKRTLTWSKPYVANWLDTHPRNDNPDAPLFHRLTTRTAGETMTTTAFLYTTRSRKS